MTARPLGPPPGGGLPGDGLPGGAGADWCEDPWWELPEHEPTDAELAGAWPDPFAGPPDFQTWLASRDELDAAGGDDALAADGSVSGCFAEAGPAQAMTPGPVLAALTSDTLDGGLGELSDDELTGVLQAARRLASWQAGVELAVAAELDQRRRAQAARPGWSQISEHVSAELAAALTLTGRSADELLSLARELARLPGVRAGLLAGRIDRAKAAVFTAELTQLGAIDANAVAAAFTGLAAAMTTGQLRAALRAMVLAIDPDALRRRAQAGQAQARVERWHEGSGNAALAGRELPPGDVIAADARLTAIARALHAAGAPGTLDTLRAAVYTALLTGRDPETLLLAHARPHDTAPDPGRSPRSDYGGTASPQPCGSASPNGHHPGGRAAGEAHRPGTSDIDRPQAGEASRLGTGKTNQPGTSKADQPGASQTDRCGAGQADRPGPGAGLLGLTGSVHLTMPLSAWLGLADVPGEVTGYGPLDADTCRDLAARLGAGHGTRSCLTLTDPGGHAAAHACARHGPSPPSPGPPHLPGQRPEPDAPGASDIVGLANWLTGLPLAWLESGACTHAQQATGYRPPPSMAHLVAIRQRTCSFPGCRRPARRCDLDHTTPYDQGGRTCQCNIAPLCRAHHRAKQAPGWQLTQPQPGVLVWTTPHGRSYTVRPQPYPT